MRVKWPENIAELMGRMSDQDLADELGIARQTVFRQRRKMGLASSYVSKINPADALSDLVGLIETAKYPLNQQMRRALERARLSLKGAKHASRSGKEVAQ